MFDYELQRRCISEKLFRLDQNRVEILLKNKELNADNQEADSLMKDLDQTRIQRSVALMNLYRYSPSHHQRDLAQLEIAYDLNTNFYQISDKASGDLVSIGTLS